MNLFPSCCSEDIFQCLASLLFARALTRCLSFARSLKRYNIYNIESRREYREQQRARIVQRERREKSLFDDDSLESIAHRYDGKTTTETNGVAEFSFKNSDETTSAKRRKRRTQSRREKRRRGGKGGRVVCIEVVVSEDALSSLEQLGIITEAKEEEKEEAKATVLEAKDEDATTGRKTPSSAEGEGGEDDVKLPVLFRMIKKGFRGPPRAGEGEKSTTNNPLNRPKYQRAEGVTKYWSPFFSPLSNIYNVPTEEPTAAERLAVLHLFFFAADFVAVKTGANMEGGFFFSNFALFADAVKTQNEWWRLPSAALADFGLEHVLATNVSLWLIGREIETLLGTTSFLAVYFLGATGGAITTLAFDDSSKLIAGSSGAVFALYGAILTYTVLNLESGWNQRGFTTRLFRIGASSIALCYIASETASDGATHVVNNWDHLGGFLSGILLAYYGLCPLFSSIQFKPGEEKNRAQRLNLEDKTLEEPFAKTSAILYGVCANLVAASVVVAFKRASGVDDF